MSYHPTPKNNLLKNALVISGITISTLAIYWQASNNGFINYDDPIYILNNQFVNQGLTWEGIKWAFTTFHSGNWHPLTWISHMLDCQIFGLSAGRHHLVSIIIHTLTSILLYLFLQLSTNQRWPSALCAALFALHPIHVESVAWASERKDLLSGLFMMLILLSYLKQCSTHSQIYRWQTLLLFALGLMAKPMLVTLPIILLLLDFWPLQRISLINGSVQPNSCTNFRSLFFDKIPFFFLSICSGAITILAQQSVGAIKTIDSTPLALRLQNTLQSFYTYIINIIYPLDLTFFYPYPPSIPLWKTVSHLSFLFLISVIVTKQYRKRPFLLMGWLWYLVTLLPVIGLIKIGLQAMADRYMYIPSIGLFIILSWFFAQLCKQNKNIQTIVFLTALSIIAILSTLSYRQAFFWKDSVSLFSRSISINSNNPTAHNYLANAYFKQGKDLLAQTHFLKSLDTNPNFIESLVNLGTLYAKSGDLQKAKGLYERAILVNKQNPESYNNLANIYLIQGKYEKAIELYKTAITLRPNYKEAFLSLAKALASSDTPDKTRQYYEKIIRRFPQWAEAHNAMGVFLAKNGEIALATEHFTTALIINPDYVQAQNNLARALKLFSKKTSLKLPNK